MDLYSSTGSSPKTRPFRALMCHIYPINVIQEDFAAVTSLIFYLNYCNNTLKTLAQNHMRGKQNCKILKDGESKKHI